MADPIKGEFASPFAEQIAFFRRKLGNLVPTQRWDDMTGLIGDDVLEVMRDHPRICRYLHVPAQSGSDRMLKAMNRGYTVGEYLEFVDRARGFLDQPEIGRPLMLAGDIIAGFCGESEADHNATAELLRRVRYKNCFIFKYSPRPGTTAFDRMPDDVPEELKRRRVNELLALQQQISDEVSATQIGRTLEVFVQGVSAREQKAARRAEAARAGAVALTISARGGVDPPNKSPAAASVIEEGSDAVQLSGRTEGDLIVVFDLPFGAAIDELVGRIVSVRIESVRQLTLFGRAACDR